MRVFLFLVFLSASVAAGAFGFDTAFWSKRGIDPFFSSVILLSHLDGTNGSTALVDQKGNTMTAGGNAHIDTAQSVGGGASMAFDGSADYFYLNNTTAFAFGTSDFTIEFWIKFNSVSAIQTIFDWRSTFDNGAYSRPDLFISTDGKLYYMTLNTAQINGTMTMSTGVWYHIAVSRVSGSTRMFVDGVQNGNTYADGLNYDAGANRPLIGVVADGAQYGLNGWIDDFRITKGVGRYSSTFTRPTPPFPDR